MLRYKWPAERWAWSTWCRGHLWPGPWSSWDIGHGLSGHFNGGPVAGRVFPGFSVCTITWAQAEQARLLGVQWSLSMLQAIPAISLVLSPRSLQEEEERAGGRARVPFNSNPAPLPGTHAPKPEEVPPSLPHPKPQALQLSEWSEPSRGTGLGYLASI